MREVHVDVVRGNAGEIMAVAGAQGGVRGVDSLAGSDDARPMAIELARSSETVIAVTGAVDLITDGKTVYEVSNGHPLMGRVTGTGCAASSTVACFAAIAPKDERAKAVACGIARYGLAGEWAAKKAHGPGSFVPAFLDALAPMPKMDVVEGLRLRQSKA
jgi:hydroxyethylthiazole kinase